MYGPYITPINSPSILNTFSCFFTQVSNPFTHNRILTNYTTLTPTPHSAKMPVKRSRAGRSSACLDAAPGKLTKSDASADAARPNLLHVASPVNTAECAAHRAKIGGFLERCHYCNKRIAQNSDVFMYRLGNCSRFAHFFH